MIWLLVALGAATGAGVRFSFSVALDGLWHSGTMVVNVVGSFLLGILSGLGLTGAPLALLGTGFCGGLTTFSSLIVQTTDRGPRHGTAYLVTTVAASLLSCWLGFLLTA